MNALPPRRQQRPLRDNDPHGATDLAAGHAVSRDQLWDTARASQVDLGVTVTEDVDVSRMVVVNIDHHAQAFGTQDGDR